MRSSIQSKVVASVLGCMAALVLATAFLVNAFSREQQSGDARRAVDTAARALASLEQSEIEKLSATLEAVLANRELRDAFVARDRERLLALAAPLFGSLRERFDVTHLYFIEPGSRTCFLRVHRPELHGDVVQRATLARAMETGEVGAGKELGQTAFALRVVKPWRGADGAIVGYVELGEEIDHFLARVKATTGNDLALALSKRHLDARAWAEVAERNRRPNDWDARPDTVVVNSTVEDPRIADLDLPFERLPEQGLLLDERERSGRIFERAVVPVRDVGGRVVGGLFVLHDDAANHQRADRQRNLLLGAIAVVTLLLAGGLVVLLRRLVLQRLRRMMEAMEDAGERLAGGDPRVGDLVVKTGDDEIGRFEEFFGRFLRVVGELMRDTSRRAG